MKKKILIFSAVAVFLLGVALFLLFWNGIILLNNPKNYAVKGVDVSHYQGEIDWEVLASQEIEFAFIKATEGSSYVDDKFAENCANAKKTDLRVGVYHFFSFESAGEAQAKNFTENVKAEAGMLPPVVDLEFYGEFAKNPPEKDVVIENLDVLLEKLEQFYGMKPIIYATEESYYLYLADDYSDYDLWIRNVISAPKKDIDWTFWQYTNRERLDGYSGEEKYIDVNVFNGSAKEFAEYNG